MCVCVCVSEEKLLASENSFYKRFFEIQMIILEMIYREMILATVTHISNRRSESLNSNRDEWVNE